VHIALRDGFAGQTVTIAVDKREVYRRAEVRTDLRISRADAFDTDVVGPRAEIEVTVEPGGHRAATRVDVAATPYLAIDVKDGTLRLSPSAERFVYM